MRGRRRLVALAVGGGVLAIALGVGAALLIDGGVVVGGVDGPLDIPRIADPYPTPSRFTMPENCGLRPATLDKVLPGHEPAPRIANRCSFHTGRLRPNARYGWLSVDFSAGKSGPHDDDKPSVAGAMTSFDIATGRVDIAPTQGQWQTVSGLADEAAVHYDTTNDNAEVVLRVQAVKAHITYGIREAVGKELRPLGEKPAVDGALSVAADVARTLGGKVDTPTIGARPGSAAALPAPEPCGLISPATLRKLGMKPTAPAEDDTPDPPVLTGANEERCYWRAGAAESETDHAALWVLVQIFSDDTQGSGEDKAERDFLKTYHELRDRDGIFGHLAPGDFHPLSAPGDQAVAYYLVGAPSDPRRKWSEGVVLFRVRNLLVQVQFEGVSGGEPIPEAAALNRAYLGAKDAAAALAG